MPEYVLYGEARKQIRAVQIVISDKDDLGISNELKEEVEVSVEPHQIEVSRQGKLKATFTFPSTISFVLSSCPGVQWVPKEGFHLRIHTNTLDNLMENVFESERSSDLFNIPVNIDLQILCSFCHQEIGFGSFSQVSDLPSEEWQELLESMWCCRNKDAAGPPKELKISPKKTECLVDDLTLLVSSEILRNGSITISDASLQNKKTLKLVWCKRCHAALGKATEENEDGSFSVSLWKFAVSLNNTNIQRVEASLCELVSHHLVSVSQSQMCFKFILESEEDHKPQLLLWLLSPDTMLLMSHTTSTFSDNPLEVKVEATTICKLLYHTCWTKDGERLSAEWNTDIMVHTLALPRQYCFDIASQLIESSSKTPLSMRKINNFMVGFL